jgi:hypothetical protein
MTQRGWEELRPYLRDERPPDDSAVVVRGGPDTLAKLTVHARRTHDAYALDGEPLWGISVYCAMASCGALPHIESSTCREQASSEAPDSRCYPHSAARTTQSGSTATIRQS